MSGEAIELPFNPHLIVKCYGFVPLPINESIAEQLIKLSTQAPYGKLYETLVDTKVRDIFQIYPASIKIENPLWNKGMEMLIKRVAKGLGCNGNITFHLYKMLIYRQGSHFKKHADTEKEKNMFATLVIQLPSIHEGGELVVYDKFSSSKKIFDFGQKANRASQAPHFVAHYADVEHEILEVKSGYRLALIYNLCWINGNIHPEVCKGDTVSKMAEYLLKSNEKGEAIALLLDHSYTPSSLSSLGVKALKGIDNNRAKKCQCAAF